MRWFFQRSSQTSSRPTRSFSLQRVRRHAFRPALELMEERALLSAYVRDFPLLVPNLNPNLAKPGPDGNVWFNELVGTTFTGPIAKITPAGQIIQVPTPVPVFDFVFGPDGNIWFSGPDYIGEMTQAGVLLHEYSIPSADEPAAATTAIQLTLGPDGNIWYVEPYVSSDIVGRLTPSGQITEYPIPFDAPYITTGPDGNLWFEATGANAIGRITPTGVVTIFNDPANTRTYRGLTSGPNGNLWATTAEYNTIVEFNTAGQLVATFPVSGSPYGLTLGPDGNLWYNEIAADANNIGRITPQGVVTEFPIPTPNCLPTIPIVGPDGNIWFTEYRADKIGEVVLDTPTTTTLASSASTPISGQALTFTATVTANSGSGTPTGSVDFVDTTTGNDLGSVTLANGVATLSTSALPLGSQTITATYSGDTTFRTSLGTTTVTVIPPASLSGVVFSDFNDDGQVDFGEQGIPNVPITLTGTDDLGHAVSLSQTTDGAGTYVFLNLRPGSYTITEAQQPAGYTPGIATVGTGGGTVSGAQFTVTMTAGENAMNYNYGEIPAATGHVRDGQTAGIGFWNNKNGQALIKALNGGVGHQLGDWLAATFPHMFGALSDGNSLAGESNACVASFFQSRFVVHGQKLDAQVLATALAVYVTDPTLDSTGVGAQYGFTVGGNGLATATVNVGSNGSAFGVADNTTMTVMDILLATDSQAVNGLLYNGDTVKRNKANTVFSALNEAGGL
jgi:streptogramin lyase